MFTLAIAIGALVLYLIAYNTYGKWLARKIFKLDSEATVPSVALNDDKDYVPTDKGIIFGHHFTSIAGTGPIVGPALAVIWGWVPALLWVLFGSILIGAVVNVAFNHLSNKRKEMLASKAINSKPLPTITQSSGFFMLDTEETPSSNSNNM